MHPPPATSLSPALSTKQVRLALPPPSATDEPQCTCTCKSSELPPLQTYISSIRNRWHKHAHLPCKHTPHVNETVARWLQSINLQAYIPHFRACEVTPPILLTLTSTELQSIGVNRLADRRQLLREINRQAKEPLCNYLTEVTPEHGRILNHLSAESLFLLWARVSIIMLTSATASIRLYDEQAPHLTKYVSITAQILAVLSILVILYAFHQFTVSMGKANDPTGQPDIGRASAVIPTALIVIIPIVTVYTIMAERSSEAALVILLAV